MGTDSPSRAVDVPADRIFTKAEPVAPPVATYTVSARSKKPDYPVFAYLGENYGNLRINEIDSLFGFVEMLVFLLVVLSGLFYSVKKGVLLWK